MAEYKLLLGDCLEKLKELPDNSVDSVVTDPPYELGFMGKKWDNTGIAFNEELWKECLRVLKPGGHLLSAGGTRTYHRMTCAIEDAGFEVRDSIQWWHYGSGFPKSHNIGKALDKRGGNNDLTEEVGQKLKEARESRGITKTEADNLFCDGTTNYMWFEGRKDGIRLPDDNSFAKIVKEWEELKPYQDKIKSANREIVGQYETDMGGLGGERLGNSGGDITIAATDVAKQWEGWGTALKPAGEPFISATKEGGEPMLADEPGFFYGAKVAKKDRNEGLDTFEEKQKVFNGKNNSSTIGGYEDGSVEDKFTTQPAKNNHPTVKPTNLMRYLVKLVTPVGGTVLDPFMGSGSTGKACMIEGFNFIGIEREQEYMDIAEARIKNAKELEDKK